MNYAEALEYIHGINRFAKKDGLENMRRLMRELGDPQDRLRFVHIAGTNGKGSAAAMTASVLQAAGYRTGLYTSPYLQRFTERIRVDGKEIPETDVARLAETVRGAIARIEAAGGQHPTELEVVGAIAFLYYEETGCDAVALEVGLGGRLDPTNVIKEPLVSVIATIGFDHMAKLGNTLEEIAVEKAGIIKANCDTVVYEQPESVAQVFREAAQKAGANITFCDFSSLKQDSFGLSGQRFRYGRRSGLEISLIGDFQMQNAALVIETADAINRNGGGGLRVPEDALRRGLKEAKWPGRMEILCENPTALIDAAHNGQCAQALGGALVKYFPGRELIYILGVVRDKDCDGILGPTLPLASHVFTVTTESVRALEACELARIVRERGGERLAGRVHACGSVAEAVRRATVLAKETGAAVCAFGSLYYIGAVRELYGK